jgi:uncharacterized protein with von Willebrand factor type A (vWA) domain
MMDPLHKYPLLYQLFLRLQQYDRHLGHKALGVKEYYALMEALNKGVGLSDEAHFKKVVHWMWRKPHHNKQVFDRIVKEGLEHIYAELAPQKDQKTPSASTQDNLSQRAPSQTQKVEKDKPQKPVADEPPKTPPSSDEPTEDLEDTLIISFERASPDKDEQGLKLDIETISAEVNQHHYLLEGNYFELGFRQLQQGVRTMRRQVVDKSKKMIDLEASIQKASRQGFLENLEYRHGHAWVTDLLIIVDQGFSMMAFKPFSDQLISIMEEDYDILDLVYFYKEMPYQYLYLDRSHLEAVSISEVAEARSQSVLIISDGGAATGRIEGDRVEQTVQFLAQIRKHRVAWLNPMPRERWTDTSAEYIAQYTNMFYLDSTELVNAVKIFKAKLKGDSLLERYVQENY